MTARPSPVDVIAAAPKRTHAVEHGDTWTIRDGRQVIIASHRWPPPKPGTHESDLMGRSKIRYWHRKERDWGDDEIVDWHAAFRWSRANATKESP